MKNTLYYGDNLEILRKLVADKVEVDLCYIDPPFNSDKNYNQIYTTAKRTGQAQAQAFVDTWTWDTSAQMGYEAIITNEGGRFTFGTIELFRGLWNILRDDRNTLAYLVSITLRLVEIHRLLKATGSFYLHCDPTASHYLKLILDSIFESKRFLSEIIWKRTSGHNSAMRWGPVHDTLLFYSKGPDYTWNKVFQPYGEEYLTRFYRHSDADGTYRLGDLTGAGTRTGDSGKPWRGVDPSESGRHWAVPSIPGFSKSDISALSVQERLEVLETMSLIYWPPKGTIPQFKRYLDADKGTAAQDVITDIDPLSPHAKERMKYPTQKPEELLERIIKASTNEGDLVLDAYCGCGTTVAVAERLRRRWIGVDITFQAIAVILKRMEDTFGTSINDTITTAGIPQDLGAAEALANRKDDKTRKEFEKWAVLTYSRNRAVIRETKGADKGIDGVAYFVSGFNETEKMVFQAKSGDVKRNDIATLKGDMEREGAKLATFITLREPAQPMKDEAAQAGIYHHPLMGLTMNRVQIVTVKEMIEDKRRLELPMTTDVLKTAPKAVRKGQATLTGLFGEGD